MKKRTIYQIDSFTKERFKGNAAGVVLNADGLNDHQMQSIARELNNSETAFLFSSDDAYCDGVIRYFTPTLEVPTCGHATIAAMYAKAKEENLDSCVLKIKTHIGVLPFEIIKINNDYQVIMTQGKFELSAPLHDDIRSQLLFALGLNAVDLDADCPIQIASTGNSKVMIGIKTRRQMNKLTPDYKELSQLSKQIDCNGYFVFTFDTGNDELLTCGRMFAPALGIDEDPVTGNANGPLGGYLVQNRIVDHRDGIFEFSAGQGERMKRFGTMSVRVETVNHIPKLVQIRGDAVVVFKTEMEV